MKSSTIVTALLTLISLSLAACNRQRNLDQHKAPKVVTTRLQAMSVTLTQQYVCQIQALRLVKIRAFDSGYLETFVVREGQAVKEGDLLFNVIPLAHQEKQDLQLAEQNLAQLELNATRKFYQDKVTPQNESLVAAKLANAEAKVTLAAAKLTPTAVKAPFDGVVDHLRFQEGSRVEKGEILATLSDSSRIRVDFNVSEARYLEYMADWHQHSEDLQINLILASGDKYDQAGKIGEIEADFNGQTGTIGFHADFPNPEGRLRHGQVGTVLISRKLKDAIVIPQRAMFELLSRRYVYVVDKDDIAHRREIVIQNELEDTFVIQRGLDVDDRVIVEGARRVRDGEKVECHDRDPKNG